MYRVFQKNENISGYVDFISIEKHCKCSNSISNYEAIEWINKNKYSYNILKKFIGYDIFSEIHGIIKGHIGLENVYLENLSNKKIYFLSLDEYINILDSYSIFNREQKCELYRFACNYQKWLYSINKCDENDLAVKFLKNDNLNNYDYIVVDEVQDLSEIEIYMIINMVKDIDNIIWTGDFNQTVNPTFFNFHRLKNIYYVENTRKIKEHKLSKNFRTTYQIVNFINKGSLFRKN